MASCTNSRLPALSDRGDLYFMRENLRLSKKNGELEEVQKLHFEDVDILLGKINSLKEKLDNETTIKNIIIPEHRQLAKTVEDQRKELQQKDEQLEALQKQNEQLEAQKSENELLRAEIERLMMILQTIQ